MPKNTMRDLRDHLFETLEALKDAEAPMALDRAKAIAEVSQVIINTAKAVTALGAPAKKVRCLIEAAHRSGKGRFRSATRP